ncbi:hypothetical protein ABMA28_006910 [Loxostege sticticalis]|uniref:Uncharacterized protein n=1 Tax=Loxostege sticticalis TaxID=481309 RepID=A0ABD0TP82_LOXSC
MSGRKLRAPAPPARHSSTTRRADMAALPLPARLLCLLVVGALTDPSPGRVPKVYNALITSNQNLEPSKAYPVYQPVLHDAFAFPFQPAVFYGDFPLTNGLQPLPAAPPKDPNAAPPPPPAAPAPEEPADDKPPSTKSPPAGPEPGDKPTPAPPLPPNTQSPIPLNQFGLPPQVLPLGRIDPAYNGFTQVGPFTYTYPNFRFYDPYDPFSFNPYTNLPPLYRPLPNVLEQNVPLASGKAAPSPTRPESTGSQSPETPPSEPNDLNVLNYSSKDPAIPNVPPPPLPDGGLKSEDKSA